LYAIYHFVMGLLKGEGEQGFVQIFPEPVKSDLWKSVKTV